MTDRFMIQTANLRTKKQPVNFACLLYKKSKASLSG